MSKLPVLCSSYSQTSSSSIHRSFSEYFGYQKHFITVQKQPVPILLWDADICLGAGSDLAPVECSDSKRHRIRSDRKCFYYICACIQTFAFRSHPFSQSSSCTKDFCSIPRQSQHTASACCSPELLPVTPLHLLLVQKKTLIPFQKLTMSFPV